MARGEQQKADGDKKAGVIFVMILRTFFLRITANLHDYMLIRTVTSAVKHD
jgi:hypothetical protein